MNSANILPFSVPEARDQLLNEGVVYTFRWARRAFFSKVKGDIENTWANEKRGGKRIAYVKIEEVGKIASTEEALEPYSAQSGFTSTILWQNKITDIGMPVFVGMEGWLYKVTKV